mmetsp:Transcript_1009/g.2889  ORF Transcript_1009/g.2889 Transcript_1009/m.2889 type:complete len:366 (-) Transcript_1009:111-1208(-)
MAPSCASRTAASDSDLSSTMRSLPSAPPSSTSRPSGWKVAAVTAPPDEGTRLSSSSDLASKSAHPSAPALSTASPHGCTLSAATPPSCALALATCFHLPPLPVAPHSRSVPSAPPVKAAAAPSDRAAAETAPLWPLSVAAILPASASKSTACPSSPPESVIASPSAPASHTTQRTPGAVVLCSGLAISPSKPANASASGKPSGSGRFLRHACSSAALASTAASTSASRPRTRLAAGASPSSPPASAPRLAGPPPAACACARASSLSLVTRAITRQAASCWYSAWLSSCRAPSSCCRSSYVSTIKPSHSDASSRSSPGNEAAAAGRGSTARDVSTANRSPDDRSCCVTGHLPCSCMYFSMSRFSKR